MKRFILPSLFFSMIFLSAACNKNEIQDLKLWYNEPALKWEEALPVGNGRIGAMIFGGVTEDHIQFNEETLWTGEPHDYSNKDASKYLGAIRDLLWQGKQKEAEKLAMETFMSVPLRQKKYQPFGDLRISFSHPGSITDYRRELDLSDAVCRTTFKSDGVTYIREYIASYPRNVLAINLNASRRRSLTFDLSMDAVHEGFSASAAADGTLILKVRVKDGVLAGTAIAKIKIKGGGLTLSGNRLHIEKADEATILLTAATSFINPNDVTGDPDSECKMIMSRTMDMDYSEILKEHIDDYSRYFKRFSIYLGRSGNEELPTDKRIEQVSEMPDNSLAALYVQYGRYLMLASSREGTYPANLQGIWNDKIDPAWDSKYTVNINTEMNYWPVEILNIAECHEALFKMIDEVVTAGEKVARNHYNSRGWVLHHNTDLWRGAAPINASDHGIWVSGSGWMAHHYWEHYLFSMDSGFLRKSAWPVMKKAAMFYADFLVRDPKTGWLISTPSNSPENGGLVAGPTMDHQIIKSLFRACIRASEILGTDRSFADTLKLMLPEIAPYRTGRFGQLQEWMEDIDDPLNKHRHVSHLWGVYPGREINWEENPELMAAAMKSLIARGDEGTGWSLAWKINFWARFREGNHAWKMVQMLLRPEGKNVSQTSGGGSSGGGSYPNLFDAHPPFQIDGNFGGASGIAEMLVQSHLEGIDILPALPDAIPEGQVKGIKARGNFELEFSWKNGRLTRLKILSGSGSPLLVRYGNKEFRTGTSGGESITLDGNLVRK
jgi:alpha-L-fucosidase 2